MLDTPFRLYDSRPGYAGAITTPKGKLTTTTRTLDVAGHGTPAVPDGATAVLTTIAVTQTVSSGYLRAWAAGTPQPATSIINWDHTNHTGATTLPVRLGTNGAINLRAPINNAHIVIDVLGWIT
jgi:hypothetical protein